MKNQLLGIFLLGVSGEISAMDLILENPFPQRVSAQDHLIACQKYVKEGATNKKIVSEFKKSVENKDDDPCKDTVLEKIARELGANDAQLGKMWDEYGLTKEGHSFFLKQFRNTTKENRLATAIKSALRE